MTPPKDTGFDAFFQAITTSPEFKSVVTKDWKGDSMDALEKSLLDMQRGVEKAGKLMDNLNTNFAIENESISDLPSPSGRGVGGEGFSGNGSNSTPPKTGNAKDEQEKPAVEVQHFVKKEGKPWGFEAVAGMDSLKTELKESFIKPLKFKFLVEKLKKEQENQEKKSGGYTKTGETERGKLSESDDIQYNKEQSERVFSPLGTFDTFGHKSMEGKESTERIEDMEGKEISKIDHDSMEKRNELLLKLYTEYEKFKISIPTGMLFYGPPGTGKTFITKKLAEELGCGFISKNMGEFGSSYLHQTTKNIKDFFEGAKKAAANEPIILFLDEIDSLVSARTNNVDANKAEEVSQFLQEFNSLELAPNLIVIAATNRPDHLDPAILRSGRLDKKIYLGPPDDIARRELFKMYIEKAGRPHGKLDYDELAKLSDGYVSADIEAICDEVARDASRDLLDLVDEAESGTLTMKDLDGHKITMESIRATITETPSSLKMVDMSVYEGWLEKIK